MNKKYVAFNLPVFRQILFKNKIENKTSLVEFSMSMRDPFYAYSGQVSDVSELMNYNVSLVLFRPTMSVTAKQMEKIGIGTYKWASSYHFKNAEIGIISVGLTSMCYPRFSESQLSFGNKFITYLYIIDDRVDKTNPNISEIALDIQRKTNVFSLFITHFKETERRNDFFDKINVSINLYKNLKESSDSDLKILEENIVFFTGEKISDLGSQEVGELLCLLELLQELVQLKPDITPTLLENFRESFCDYIHAIVIEKQHESKTMSLDLKEQAQVRKSVSGALCVLDLAAVLFGIDLSAWESTIPFISILKHITAAHVGETNDWPMSLNKEIKDIIDDIRNQDGISLLSVTPEMIMQHILNKQSLNIFDRELSRHTVSNLPQIHADLSERFNTYVYTFTALEQFLDNYIDAVKNKDEALMMEQKKKGLDYAQSYINSGYDVFVDSNKGKDFILNPETYTTFPEYMDMESFESAKLLLMDTFKGCITHPIAAVNIPRYNLGLPFVSTLEYAQSFIDLVHRA